jgi:CHAD domain-containing protein
VVNRGASVSRAAVAWAAMRRTLERELKLRAGEGFELPDLGGEELEPRVFVSTYYDAPDLRLARAGVTLRHRTENGRGLWQLKLPRRGSRLELELSGPKSRPPEDELRLLVGLLRGRELAEVARLRTRRVGVRVDGDGNPLAEVVFDSVAVMDGRRVTQTWEELEVELLEGADDRELRRIGKALRQAGAEETDGRTKLAQALGVQAPAPVEPDATTEGALRGMLVLQLARILAHDPGVRLGDDLEDVHQMRVATRRLRAFLRSARDALDGGWGEPLREELRWLAGLLGGVRDLDVLLDYLRREAEVLDPAEREAFAPVFAELEEERERARGALLEGISGDRYFALLDRIEAAAAAPAVAAEAPELASLFAAELRRLRRRAGAHLASRGATDAELHDARIRTKRARYAAEFAEPALGDPGKKFVSAAKDLQDVLGEHQDAVVAEERIRALAGRTEDPEARFAAGRLVERQRARRAAARAEVQDAWERVERLGRKAL